MKIAHEKNVGKAIKKKKMWSCQKREKEVWCKSIINVLLFTMIRKRNCSVLSFYVFTIWMGLLGGIDSEEWGGRDDFD